MYFNIFIYVRVKVYFCDGEVRVRGCVCQPLLWSHDLLLLETETCPFCSLFFPPFCLGTTNQKDHDVIMSTLVYSVFSILFLSSTSCLYHVNPQRQINYFTVILFRKTDISLTVSSVQLTSFSPSQDRTCSRTPWRISCSHFHRGRKCWGSRDGMSIYLQITELNESKKVLEWGWI